MTLLVLFAIAAGAGTALSPCVLPVLPALLSAGATGGRRRPLGVVLGLATTFTITVAGFASVIDGVGLGDGTLRSLAVIALLVFGLALLVPRLADRIEAPLSRLARFGPRSRGDGFWSGIGVGARARLRLRALRRAGAGGGDLGRRRVGQLARGGAGATRSARRSSCSRSASAAGASLAARAAAGAAARARRGDDPDRAGDRHAGRPALPDRARRARPAASSSTRPARSSAPSRSRTGSRSCAGRRASTGPPGASAGSKLKVLGEAPDFAGDGHWFNTPGDRPLTLEGLRGRVVLIDFWTYTCINCLRTLPHVRAWDARYRARGLTIVGVHTPEFDFEHDTGNVARRDRAQQAALSRRPGQRLRDLERVGQPVLAGEVPDRRQGPRPLRPLRRGRLRQDRGGDPLAARGGRRGEARRAGAGLRGGRGRGAVARDLPRREARAGLVGAAARRHAHLPSRRPRAQPLRPRRHLADRRRGRRGGARRDRRRAVRRAQGLPRAELARRAPAHARGARRRARSRAGSSCAASASTSSSRCRAPGSTG